MESHSGIVYLENLGCLVWLKIRKQPGISLRWLLGMVVVDLFYINQELFLFFQVKIQVVIIHLSPGNGKQREHLNTSLQRNFP